MSESEKVTARRMRTNTYPTREYTHRGRGQGADISCRRCQRGPETLGHILGSCLHIKKQRIERHDYVCKEVVSLAKKRGFTVFQTPRIIGEDNMTYFPDLVLQRDKEVYIVDPTVVWDSSKDKLHAAGAKKISKYATIREPVRTLTGGEGEIEVMPLVVGGRGAWHNVNNPLTTLLDASKGWCRTVSLKVLCRSIRMLSDFMDN